MALGPAPARATILPPGNARRCDGSVYRTDLPTTQSDVASLTGTPAQ
jgi:hypothetical protein